MIGVEKSSVDRSNVPADIIDYIVKLAVVKDDVGDIQTSLRCGGEAGQLLQSVSGMNEGIRIAGRKACRAESRAGSGFQNGWWSETIDKSE